MELEVKYGLIKDLPKDGQTYLCSCEPKCTGYVYIEGAGRFCKNDADEIATAIKAQVRTINQLGPIKRKYRWTEQEEDIVKKWVREKGLEYGDIKTLSEIIGRTYAATVQKIYDMRKVGKL